MRTLHVFLIGIGSTISIAHAQQLNKSDTILVRWLDSVRVISSQQTRSWVNEPSGNYMFSGKKTEQIKLSGSSADIAGKNARQIFATVPGVFVYDMDGAGNQINIGARGLDPHRSWEFNMRKDGIITNSDMYAYPASHFSMPLESIERIEIVRGTGSLQYGAQFGGMINFISKQPDSSKKINADLLHSLGSYQMRSAFYSISGKWKKWTYTGYVHIRERAGYRDAESSSGDAQSLMLQYTPSEKWRIRMEWSRNGYQFRSPGPLNDSQYAMNPRQATRTRNYYSPIINIPSVQIFWNPDKSTAFSLSVSAVLGSRNSVQFDKTANIKDSINTSTGAYNNRQVDIDFFNSYTVEWRVSKKFQWLNKFQQLSMGIQYMHNELNRKQLGQGTNGSDYNLTLVNPIWGRDLYFHTENLALFSEHKLEWNKRLTITGGVRLESGLTKLSGNIVYYPQNQIPVNISHQFLLWGAGWEYKISNQIQWYGGVSSSYRPMIFKDLIPASVYERVDPAIKDESGYNAETGIRGNIGGWNWDINTFALRIKNRFGTLYQTDAVTNDVYTYRTNTGNSLATGLEMLIQKEFWLSKKTRIQVFSSNSWMKAIYTEGSAKKGSTNVNIQGNKVESAPDFTSRNGISYKTARYFISVNYSYVSENYADALNTKDPAPGTGAVGLVPAYALWDMSAGYSLGKRADIKFNLNNMGNLQYFTKRPLLYPGPGIWPSDGRNFTLSLGLHF
ncbi:MAG: TonB-dependent receptor [Chitinophagaceae bacterium]|nr:TonB-dependent receptor [Chitinophagaceae bacterium]